MTPSQPPLPPPPTLRELIERANHPVDGTMRIELAKRFTPEVATLVLTALESAQRGDRLQAMSRATTTLRALNGLTPNP